MNNVNMIDYYGKKYNKYVEKNNKLQNMQSGGYDDAQTETIECSMSPVEEKQLTRIDRSFKPAKLGKKVKIVSYYLQGNLKGSMVEDRIPMIKSILQSKSVKPDIICLQSVSKDMLESFEKEPFFAKKYLFSEVSRDINWKNRSYVTTVTLTSIPTLESKLSIFTLRGNRNYSCTITDLGSFVVININLQETPFGLWGKKRKPFSICRFEMLELIYKLIADDFAGKSIVLCGGFHFNIDKAIREEIGVLKLEKLQLKDIWNDVHPNLPGFTEDTCSNTSYWNITQKFKRKRTDGFLYRGDNILRYNITMFGTEPNTHIPIDSLGNLIEKFKLKPYKIIKNQYGEMDWWASTHYGLLLDLKLA